MAWRDALGQTTSDLLTHLADVQEDLATLYDSLYFTKREELRLKAEGWSSSSESTAAAKTRASSHRALEASLTVLELEGREKQLTEEKFFLIRLLEAQK